MYHTFEARLALANRIYELDAKVYRILGSGLGRVFNNQKESTCRNLAELMADPSKLHYLRSEMALIGNMARTIPDRKVRSQVMKEYSAILSEIENLPDFCSQSTVGIYTSTVTDMSEPYIKPQENGNRGQVRYLKLTDNKGKGLMIFNKKKYFSCSANW